LTETTWATTAAAGRRGVGGGTIGAVVVSVGVVGVGCVVVGGGDGGGWGALTFSCWAVVDPSSSVAVIVGAPACVSV
jgi:hypothetical protein